MQCTIIYYITTHVISSITPTTLCCISDPFLTFACAQIHVAINNTANMSYVFANAILYRLQLCLALFSHRLHLTINTFLQISTVLLTHLTYFLNTLCLYTVKKQICDETQKIQAFHRCNAKHCPQTVASIFLAISMPQLEQIPGRLGKQSNL